MISLQGNPTEVVLGKARHGGELALGNLGNPGVRKSTLNDLASLPFSVVAGDPEVMELIDRHGLWGLGLGWIDAHLLASALLSHCRFWTIDKRLHNVAVRLKLA